MPSTAAQTQPLLVFSRDKYVLIDDYNQKILGPPVLIKSTWPQLSQWNMDADLDAAYWDPAHKLIVFLKGQNCALYKTDAKSFVHGAITDFFNVPAEFAANVDGAILGGSGDQQAAGIVYFSKGSQYVQGGATDPTASKPTLAGPYPITGAGWTPWPSDDAKIVASEDIFPPGSAAKGVQAPISTYVLAQDNQYACWFYPGFVGPNVVKTLNDLWPGYDALNMTPVDAVMRLDPSLVDPNVNPNPTPVPDPSPNPSNPLCAELQTIMKSICSLTLLMHKAIDACYPQTSWPTIPYPDGCGSGRKGGCGCKDHPLDPSNPLDPKHPLDASK